MRVGHGFDVHQFSGDPGRPLMLGGCEFEGEPGLVGHSDADAVSHAIAEALLGAGGLGDLGEHYPDTDERWRDADSLEILGDVVVRLRAAGWVPGNVDCSVVCERPRLSARRQEMQERLSDVLKAPVTVKGRRPEGLGALGRGEGVACMAVALVVRSAEDSSR
ncbi:MAG: 2-C-methyl-D-erythritol 2,4-cyclodiphosphate synthase [Acidimicrobiia bacterium]|nr:2-C-methyl-D-erythritol 2,4-cyclodiphosphate synthase [Acidimicrobiia bacterium]MBA3984526.1 2-C-methyl-D-erythritol 2,4-cyclodiphosphate synthase [Acidimicrobiia bacterium]MDQ3390997.1 2-C-methyl-D-erythritol 2,4-cyclodiphosphate synthase [Actinomycetota bacterium]